MVQAYKTSAVIGRYLFRSGNQEHPGDKIENTTVEILPFSVSKDAFWLTITVSYLGDTLIQNNLCEGSITCSQTNLQGLYYSDLFHFPSVYLG